MTRQRCFTCELRRRYGERKVPAAIARTCVTGVFVTFIDQFKARRLKLPQCGLDSRDPGGALADRCLTASAPVQGSTRLNGCTSTRA